MKTKFTIALFLLVAAAACSSIQEEPVNTDGTLGKSEEVFYATLEQGGEADATKVYAGDNLKVLWNADDRISIYNKYTYGFEYAFQGASGETTGVFAKVEDDAEFVVGNKLDNIYALYPYRDDNRIDESGELSITWPSSQTYKPDSFGMGANIMVSVTTNNQLCFKNVGGYLALKLYGDNVSVSSIELRGNNGEKLSGKATITFDTEEDPTLFFDVDAQETLRLECATPVEIGSTAESATVFWLVIPPASFTEGFSITVRTVGGIFAKSTESSYNIQRNTLCRMAAVEVVPTETVSFEDENFKAYCVTNFDSNGDGEVSLDEAHEVISIDVNTDDILSLGGIECFTNLMYLNARGSFSKYLFLDGERMSYGGGVSALPDPEAGTSVASGQLSEVVLSGLTYLQAVDISRNNCISSFIIGGCPSLRSISCETCNISEIDLSQNTALTTLFISENPLTSLDVSNNTALTRLRCDGNQLTSLDVSNNTALYILECAGNQLTSLDVSDNTALITLRCQINQLSVLNVSNNTLLTRLDCHSNQLTTLNVSYNTGLTELILGDNQLTSLDVSNNPALTSLYCRNNLLTAIDLSNNTALTGLECYGNQLMSLDLSHNTALTSLTCYTNQLTSLDVSNNTALTWLQCNGNPYLTEIWLKTGQTINYISYDSSVAQIHYKD